MAIPAKSLEEVLLMNEPGRTEYFEQYARYIPDAPRQCYAIRVGSKTIQSDDTWDLRKKFDRHVDKLKTGTEKR